MIRGYEATSHNLIGRAIYDDIPTARFRYFEHPINKLSVIGITARMLGLIKLLSPRLGANWLPMHRRIERNAIFS